MQKSNIAEIHQLSHVQKALLINYLKEEEDQGLIQVRSLLEGDLNGQLYQKAWKTVIENHKALKTSIYWKNISKPIQIVSKNVELSWDEQDLSHMTKSEQEGHLKAYMDYDRKKGIRLDDSPNWRFALLRLDINHHLLIWTCHHILIDGWSSSIAINQSLNYYDSYFKDEKILFSEVPSFFDYLNWVKKKNITRNKEFWMDYLSGFDNPSLVEPIGKTSKMGSSFLTCDLDKETSNQLKLIAIKNGVSLSILFQSLWAIILSKLLKRSDIAFGMTFSGRSGADLSNIDQSVGMFMNTLPFRVKLNFHNSFSDLLRCIQQIQNNLNQLDYIDFNGLLVDDNISKYNSLFDTLFIFENFINQSKQSNHIFLKEFESGVTTNYPISIIVIPNDRIKIAIFYRLPSISKNLAHQVLENLRLLIRKIIQDVNQLDLSFTDDIILTRNKDDEKKLLESVNDGFLNRELDKKKPQSEWELKLSEMFKRILGLNSVGIDEDFFLLGGTSLMAVTLIERLNKAFKRNLSITSIIKNSTIEKLTRLVAAKTSSDNQDVVIPLNNLGGRIKLFCLHSPTGNLLLYHTLFKELGEDFSLYGVQPNDQCLEIIKNKDLKELASYYLNEIKQYQNIGPYAILSYCATNALAIEMSKQLLAEGQITSSLILIDSKPVGVELIELSIWDKLRVFSSMIISRRFDLVYEQISIKYRIEKNRLLRKEKNESVNNSKNQKDLEVFDKLDVFLKDFSKLNSNYILNPYPGSVVYIQSTEMSKKFLLLRIQKTWEKLILNGTKFHTINCSHLSFFGRPHVVKLAEIVRDSLRD